jgi:hypothetical protein
MTTAFLAEVDTVKGTMYIGKKGKFSKIPFFFAQSNRLKDIIRLATSLRNFGPEDYFSNRRDQERTRIVVVENIEKGLRSSTGGNISVVEFMNKEYSSGQYAPSKPANAVFKIALSAMGKNRKRFAGTGKFGKTWESQGHVRLHLTNNLQRMMKEGYYTVNNAQVMMIELEADGVTPKKITYTPILEWYMQSPPCKLRIQNLDQASLSSFDGDLTQLSPYA